MTYDPAFPYKNVDGVNINLTVQEIADIAAAHATYVPPPPPIPDLATQLAAALINANIIPASALHASTLDAVNAVLQATGQSEITTTILTQPS